MTKKKFKAVLFFQLLAILSVSVALFACNGRHSYSEYGEDEANEYTEVEDEDESGTEEDNEEDDDEGIEDGTHSASVDYYNPKTGYRNTYSLAVEVEDGQVTEIDFPNGGYIDGSRMSGGEVDEDGSSSVEDDEGRTFDIQIDE